MSIRWLLSYVGLTQAQIFPGQDLLTGYAEQGMPAGLGGATLSGCRTPEHPTKDQQVRRSRQGICSEYSIIDDVAFQTTPRRPNKNYMFRKPSRPKEAL